VWQFQCLLVRFSSSQRIPWRSGFAGSRCRRFRRSLSRSACWASTGWTSMTPRRRMLCGRRWESFLRAAAHLHHVFRLQEDRAGDAIMTYIVHSLFSLLECLPWISPELPAPHRCRTPGGQLRHLLQARVKRGCVRSGWSPLEGRFRSWVMYSTILLSASSESNGSYSSIRKLCRSPPRWPRAERRYEPQVVLSGQQSSMPFLLGKEILRIPRSKRACYVIFI
jgi:hypothetical protein